VLGAVKGHQRAIGSEDAVQIFLHGSGVCAGGQGQDHAVERSAQGKCFRQGPLAHPEDAVAPVVGHGFSGSRFEHELRGQPDADNTQDRACSMYGRGQRMAGDEAMGLGKGLADHDLVRAAWLWKAALAQMETVDLCLPIIRDGQDEAIGRFAQARDVEDEGAFDPCFQRRHAGNLFQARAQCVRRTFEVAEDVSQAMAGVILVPGRLKGQDQPARHDHDHQPAGHDQGDCGHLPFHGQQVAQEFRVQGAHFTTPVHWPGGEWGWP
jgi:hypothetical protein